MTVEIRKLRKEYDVPGGQEVAVDDIDLQIGDDEFLTLVGPSGCGKSTTLRCVAGLETPTSGEIRIGGEDVTDVPAHKRGLAMMFQDIALYPHMTVRENIAYPLKVRGIAKDVRHDEAADAAEIMRISELLDKYPAELSGGQRQRTALARTVVYDPRAFLMDEPLSDLDAKLKVAIRKEIQRVHSRVESPTLYVTHDQGEALSMSDRVAVMNDGRILGIDTPDNIYHYPENQFVASFIGNPSMNFLDATLESRRNGTVTVSVNRTEIELDSTGTDPEDEAVSVGFRPEAVSLGTDGGDGHFEGTLELVERIGDRKLMTLDGPGGEIRAFMPDHQDVATGTRLPIRIDERKLHVFDGATGKAVARGDDT